LEPESDQHGKRSAPVAKVWSTVHPNVEDERRNRAFPENQREPHPMTVGRGALLERSECTGHNVLSHQEGRRALEQRRTIKGTSPCAGSYRRSRSLQKLIVGTRNRNVFCGLTTEVILGAEMVKMLGIINFKKIKILKMLGIINAKPSHLTVLPLGHDLSRIKDSLY